MLGVVATGGVLKFIVTGIERYEGTTLTSATRELAAVSGEDAWHVPDVLTFLQRLRQADQSAILQSVVTDERTSLRAVTRPTRRGYYA